MKKFFSLGLLSLAMIFGFSACDDDDDLPNVSFAVNFEDATVVDGTIYVVQGETFEIESVTPINNDGNSRVEIGPVTYYWDYQPLGASAYKPYAFEITVSPNTGTGKHILELTCQVFAVDKSPARALMSYPVVVVASEDELPYGDTSVVQYPQLSDAED